MSLVRCIQSVAAQGFLCPLRHVEGDNEPEPLDVLDRETHKTTAKLVNVWTPGASARPFIIGENGGLQIRVSGSEIKDVTQVCVEWPSGWIFWSDIKTQSGEEKIFTVYPRPHHYTYTTWPPGAWRGEMRFSFLKASGSPDWKTEFVAYENVPMDFFWLPFSDSSEIPSLFRTEGVPISLLRMFLPNRAVFREEEPYPISHPKSSRDPSPWIEHVVKIIHGIRKAKTFEVQTSDKHWLKYDVFNGNSFFMGDDPDQAPEFDLDQWIQAYHVYDKEGFFTRVNCYDQCSVTELVLSLGYPYYHITWEYKQPFGFISGHGLVGYDGESNNPYFKENADHKLRPKDPSDTIRTPLRNHAFLTIGPVEADDPFFFRKNPDPVIWDEAHEIAQRRKIIDTCIGPFRGFFTRYEYLSSMIETEGVDLKRLEGAPGETEKWMSKSLWSAGITGNRARPEPCHRLPLDIHHEYPPSFASSSKAQEPLPGIVYITEDIANSTFENVLYGKTNPTGQYAFRTWTTDFEDGNSEWLVQAWIPGKFQTTFLCMTIAECTDSHWALDKMNTRSKFLTPTTGKWKLLADQEGVFVWGLDVQAFFMYRNLFVLLGSESKTDDLSTLVKLALEILGTLKKLPLET